MISLVDLAIVVSVHKDRIPLFRRSLKTWAMAAAYWSIHHEVRVCVQAEGWNPADLYELEQQVSYIAWSRPSGSHISGYNHWVQKVEAEVYLFTHPEILFPRTTLEAAYFWTTKIPGRWHSFYPLWIPPSLQEHIDNYPWFDRAEELERHPALCDPSWKRADWNRDARLGRKPWISTTTFALHRSAVPRIFPLPDFGTWGPDDPYFVSKAQSVGIDNHTIHDPHVFHQYHPINPRADYLDEVLDLARPELEKLWRQRI